MATLKENINQAIANFDSIKAAIEEQGVEVPYGTDTSEYPTLIAQIVPKTFILSDEQGTEVLATTVDKETILTATANDIREGAVAATDSGITTGTKVIPSYHTSEGVSVIQPGNSVSITTLVKLDRYDYTKLQAIICDFNSDLANSVSANKVVINDTVYEVMSTAIHSVITKNSTSKTIDFGITNNTGKPLILRFFTYKEIY